LELVEDLGGYILQKNVTQSEVSLMLLEVPEVKSKVNVVLTKRYEGAQIRTSSTSFLRCYKRVTNG
jgi:methyl coenzyme M reductase subunit C-like uncharacterized protein (methanogenesis marker protein 7)